MRTHAPKDYVYDSVHDDMFSGGMCILMPQLGMLQHDTAESPNESPL